MEASRKMKTFDFKRMDKTDTILVEFDSRAYSIKDRFELKHDDESSELIWIKFVHEIGNDHTDEYKTYLIKDTDKDDDRHLIETFSIRRGETINAFEAVSTNCKVYKNGSAVITLEDSSDGSEFKIRVPKAAFEAHNIVM